MTGYWPEESQLQVRQAFLDPSANGFRIQITFIGPDGQEDGEPLEITAKTVARAVSTTDKVRDK